MISHKERTVEKERQFSLRETMGRPKKPVKVREVWAQNLREEFDLLKKVLVDFPYVAMDTEFPGTIFSFPRTSSPPFNYHAMKTNVDNLKLIQVGLTLSDAAGELPDFETDYSYVWEFNFRDFDVHANVYNVDSIALLRKQGIDFERNREEGIDSGDFAVLLSTLEFFSPVITWVAFHSAYDFGFLIKILLQKKLPEDLDMFMRLVRVYFGHAVYDLKYMMEHCGGLYGGLERLAKVLQVDRVAGKSHQAGSDSLLTMHAFLKFKDLLLCEEGESEHFKLQLYGLA